ncbi:MAG TPA: competence/damage-inducible protein A [Clostridiales bacterium]|nr:competence/damage-inducible protein A [Clostridiales bacterium]
MNAEILCVGTEILLGDIVNTNAAYLARELAALGIGCYYQSVVGDNAGRLAEGLQLALSRADMVITTGGLGPTYDDLTKETVAELFGLSMELHRPSLEKMEAMFKGRGRVFTKNNEKQAYFPKGAHIFDNDQGTAPGLAVESQGKVVILLPGPPREMTAMFQKQVRPYLESRSTRVLRSHTIHLFDIGESTVEDRLHQSMLDHENPTIAPYAKLGEVQLRVTASAADEAEAEALMQPVMEEICALFADHVYGVDVEDLQHALVGRLQELGQTIAVAESCTGGALAKRLTDIPGASRNFLGGVVVYTNEAKARFLDIPMADIEEYGAVSREIAERLARSVRGKLGADLGVGITGLAGPEGDGVHEVGTVFIALAAPEETFVREGHFTLRGRSGVRLYACQYAFDMIRRYLTGLPVIPEETQ